MKWWCLCLCVLLAGWCSVCVVRGYDLEERKVIFLDRTPASSGISNYLFRGNGYMNNATNKLGFKLPENFYLIDIKFIYNPNDPEEKGDVVLEQTYFKAHPNEGNFTYKIIIGDAQDPSLYLVSLLFVNSTLTLNILSNATIVERAKNLSDWEHDDLPVYIPSINKLLYTARSQPTVIYLHCECGCDRTGEIAGAYAMKYLNMTYTEVTAWNEKIAVRPILPTNQFALHWYCFYLTIVEGFNYKC